MGEPGLLRQIFSRNCTPYEQAGRGRILEKEKEGFEVYFSLIFECETTYSKLVELLNYSFFSAFIDILIDMFYYSIFFKHGKRWCI